MNFVMGITLASGLLMFIGLVMITVWVMVVDAYTAYFMWRCRRSPYYFAKHVLKLPVAQWQATHLHAVGHSVGKSHQIGKLLRLAKGYRS